MTPRPLLFLPRSSGQVQLKKTERSLSRSRKWFLATGTIGLSLFISLLLLEVGLQFAGFSLQKTNHQRLFVEYDADRGWRNIPHVKGDYKNIEYNIRLQYNGRGIRGPERPYAKPPGVYRIVVVGDSFIDGYSVALEDRVTERLEQLLNTLQTNQSVEVIALGTAGYSTDQELLWLQSEGLRYHPDLVVLMFYFNDIWYNAQSRYWRGAKPLFVLEGETLRLTNVPVPDLRNQVSSTESSAVKHRSVLTKIREGVQRRSQLYGLGLHVLEGSPWLYNRAIKAGIVDSHLGKMMTEESDRALPKELMVFKKTATPEVAQAWNLTEALLQKMAQTATNGDARFLAFYIPVRERVYPSEWETLCARLGLAKDDWELQQVVQRFLSSCDKNALVCIEPTARFKEEAMAASGKRERLYYQYDNHWNARGHAFAAKILAEYILSRSFL